MADTGRDFDVAVIGAGAAGRAAASAASKTGARVVLIEQGAVDRLDLPDSLAAMPGTRAWGLFAGGEIGVIHEHVARVLRAGAIVVATGARDVIAPFPGWTLDRVYRRDEARALLRAGAFPSHRVAIIGDGATPDLDALLATRGAAIVARVPSAHFGAFAATGAGAVEAVTLDGQIIPADAVIFVIGRQPDDALARMAGAASIWRPELGGNVPVRDALLRVDGDRCWVAGDAAGVIDDPAIAVDEGALAGECAGLAALGASTGAVAAAIEAYRRAHPDRVPMDALPRADDPLAAWLRDLSSETIVCGCEGISAGTIRAAIAAGARSINDVKRRTRAGMGSCQGSRCNRVTGVMLAMAGVAELDPAPMTSRPPAGLLAVGELARLQGV